MTIERYLNFQNQTVFSAHRNTRKSTLLVFLHGIGDSHISYLSFFSASNLINYDIFIPDLLGYGRSSNSKNYSFKNQAAALNAQLLSISNHYDNIFLVPHSMGGIHATMIACSATFASKIKGIYAIETPVTQYGSFISEALHKVVSEHTDFNKWLTEFKESVYHQGVQNSIFREYYAGLTFARPEAFLQNSLEMRQLATALPEQTFTSKVGHEFAKLIIPKVYSMGKEGKQQQSIPFLQENNIPIEYFPTKCHWVAQSCPDQFCLSLKRFVEQNTTE